MEESETPGQNPPPLPTPPTGMVYIRRRGIVECQNGSIHSHSMVSVMFLLLNLLFCFCMQLFRLGHLTVCLVDMLCGIIALKLIWLYNGWHEYVPLPLYQISTRRKSTDSSCHILLTLVSSFSLSLSFLLSLSLSLRNWLRGFSLSLFSLLLSWRTPKLVTRVHFLTS